MKANIRSAGDVQFDLRKQETYINEWRNIMKELTINEISEVSGGAGAAQTVVTVGVGSGSAAIGSYLAAARFGATLGSAAGPLGAIVGGMVGAGACYFYFQRPVNQR